MIDLETLLREYMYRRSCRYEDDLTQLCNNVSFRAADPLDHLEMIMAQVRSVTAQQIFSDISLIIDLSHYE